MGSSGDINPGSWIPMIKPYLEKIFMWDECINGDFVDYAIRQVKYAMAIREENDRSGKRTLYHPFYKQECDFIVMCAFFCVVFSESSIKNETKKLFERALVDLANSKGYDTIYFKNRLMESVGSPVRFVKIDQIDDFVQKKPYYFN